MLSVIQANAPALSLLWSGGVAMGVARSEVVGVYKKTGSRMKPCVCVYVCMDVEKEERRLV